ncbi:T9SS type A sorting domain-containing protein [Calditrichota bacterium]
MILSLGFSLMFTLQSLAQDLITFGDQGDVIYGAYLNENGDYALCGASDGKLWLLELSPDGEVILECVYDDIQGGRGYDLVEVDGGGYLIGGSRHVEGENRHNNFLGVRTDENGDIEWYNYYDPGENYDYNWCNDVIELKNDDFILAGVAGEGYWHEGYPDIRFAWMVRVDGDGDMVWSHSYHGNWESEHFNRAGLFSILEAGDNVLGSGQVTGKGAWIFSASQENGEKIWEKFFTFWPDTVEKPTDGHIGYFPKIFSLDGSYHALGKYQGPGERQEGLKHLHLSFDGEGRNSGLDEIDLPNWTWDDERIYPSMGIEAARSLEGGIAFAMNTPHWDAIIRLDEYGGFLWMDTLSNVSFSAMVVDDTEIVVFGYSYQFHKPFMYKLSDHSAPYFLSAGHDNQHDYDREDDGDRANRGNGYYMDVLLGETVRFWVDAADRQDDEIEIAWNYDGEEVSDSSIADITFEELGMFDVVCKVTDDGWETADSLWWRVTVSELYIEAYRPLQQQIWLEREQETVFSIDVAAMPEVEVGFRWLVNGEEVATEDHYRLESVEDFGLRNVTAIAYTEQAADSVSWQLQLRSVFADWQPHETAFVTEVGTQMEFSVELYDGLPDSAEIFWVVDDDTVSVGELVVEAEFDRVGESYVWVLVRSDSVFYEDIFWNVTVVPLSVGDDADGLLPETGFVSIAPNPFNSTTVIQYALEQGAEVRMTVYDIAGREVASVVDDVMQAGYHTARFDGEQLPAGVYMARLQIGDAVEVRKLALVK